ncbi:MAG: type II secretion system GspH family protein, partial [Bryobacterales bacterium]|nr:type II secretion system GspH family protein [Bryobacterales bacterium]
MRQRGFSLLELSIVLVVIGVITGLGITAGVNQLERSRENQTSEKMKTIMEAVMTFRTVNGRIPCPSSLTAPPTDTNYGVEAANKGSCTGGSPAANFSGSGVADGGVPVKALLLPDDFMFDGWGNRIRYSVRADATATNAFSSIPANDTCGGIQVRDASGNNRTSSALIALISHGSNGHGAYTRSGAVRSSGSTEASE